MVNVVTADPLDSAPTFEPRLIDIELPRLRMSTLQWGPDDGRLALCVHGFPDSAHGWRLLAPLLAAKGFRVVAPFMRGYAPTGPAPDDDYSVGALMGDLIALHGRLDGGADAVVIGHDWGGWTAGALAAYGGSPFGDHIALALAPVATISVPDQGFGRVARMAAAQLRKSWYIVFFQLPLLPQRMLRRVIPRLWKDWSPPGSMVGEDVARTLNALPTVAHRRAAVSYYRTNLGFRRPAPYSAGLTRFRFKVPRRQMLMLYGDLDGAIEPAFLSTVIEALPPGSREQLITGAGHFLQVDKPDAVCAAILDYLGASH